MMRPLQVHVQVSVFCLLSALFLCSINLSASEKMTAMKVQSVGITSPTASDEYKFGDAITINWQNTNLGSNDQFAIYYSVNGGNFAFIASPFHSQLTNSGNNSSYSWTAPDLGASLDNDIRIRVLNNTQSLSDTSEVFRIYFEPNLEIITPKATEQYKFRESITFSWKNQDLGANDQFAIYYRVDGGNFAFIASPFHSQLTNSGDTSVYNWTLPDLGANLESQIDIRILNNTRNVMDTSETFRAYFEPDLDIITPIATEQYKFRESIAFSWKNQDLGANDQFAIYYRVDGGNFAFIASPFHSQLTNSGDTSVYNWTLPDLGANLESQIDIRILNNTRNVMDTSETFRAYFEPNLEIITPIATEQYKFRESIAFSWKNQDLGVNDQFAIYYRVDGGNFAFIASPFHSQLTNSGDTSVYNWTLPDLGANLESQIDIRILNNTRNVMDTSETFRAYFEPNLEIITPIATAQYKFRESIAFSWKNQDLGANDQFAIYYRVDGGNFAFIASPFHSQLTNSGDTSVYNWTLPDLGANLESQIDIRILNNTRNVMDTSETFRAYFEPLVALDIPDSTDQFKFGEQVVISWLNNDLGANDQFALYYNVDGGNYSFIGSPFHSQLTNDGKRSSYNWIAPDLGASLNNDVTFRVLNNTRNVADTTSTFKLFFDANVEILAPSEGQYIFRGSTAKVTWENGDLGSNDRFSLSYSIDGGSRFTFVASPFYSQLTNDGNISTYNWNLPLIGSSNVVFVVSNSSRNKSDTTDAFTICFTCPDLNLSSPNGGEQLTAGSTTSIRWSTGQTWLATDSIIVSLSTDAGVTFSEQGIFNGSYDEITNNEISWIVPNQVTDLARIRVQNFTQSISDESNANFSIIPAPTPSLSLTKPNGGEVLTGGQLYNIQWTSQNIVSSDSLYLELSSDNGSTYSIIEKALFSTYASRFTWAVPEVTATEAIVRVRNITNPIEDISDNVFTILAPVPVISLIQPNGGEALTVGETFNITWSTQFLNDTDNITVDFSSNAGETYSEIASGTVENFAGRFSWTVPNTVTQQARIRITSANLQVISSSDFSIALPPDPLVTLTSPNGGETMEAGESFNITWTLENTASTDQLSIAHSIDGGVNYTEIANGTVSTFNGTYSWTVPFEVGTNNKIKVTNTTADVADESDANFTIQATPTITVITPNGGESITVGDEFEVTWTSENIGAEEIFIVELTTNGGASYIEIARGAFVSTYNWMVPDLPNNSSSMIRVSTTARDATDRSNNFFSIVAPVSVVVTNPNGGELWEVGSQQTIRWSGVSFESNDLIQVFLSTDNGASFELLTEGSSRDFNGSFNFQVPATNSTQCLVKVLNDTKAVEDISDATFEMGTVDRTLTVERPNGGETWLVGTQEIISWTTTNTPDNDQLMFEISFDGGTTFTRIGSITTFGAYNNNQASYGVPNTQSDNVIIQLTNVTRGISDQSDAPLSIVSEISPVWFSLEGNIVGDELSLDYLLNEVSTLYLVAVAAGDEVPTESAIKLAAQGENPIPNQILAATADFNTLGTPGSTQSSGVFVREAFYDIHAIAEDIDGNISNIQSLRSLFATFTPAEQDSVTINEIYEIYDGASWRNTAENWTGLALSAREEVTLNDDNRVVGLDLSDKGIVGDFSNAFFTLSALASLDISQNGFTSLLSLESMTALTSLNVSDNALDFGDLLLAESLLSNASNYTPQASVRTVASDTIPTGSSFLLQAFTQGAGNNYTWRLSNLLATNEVVTAATQASYFIDQLVFENMGTYRLTIENPAFPDLILESDEIVIAASANLTGSIQGINDQPLAIGNVRLLQIIESDTGYFNARTVPVSNGAFTANNLVIGRYLAITDSEQLDAEDKKIYLPTYYRDTDLWTEADTILLFNDQDINDYTMQFFPAPLGPDDGEGVVVGTVESDFDEGRLLERRKVKKAGCSVRRFRASGRDIYQDGTWELLAYVETNDNGEFEFNFLPPGLYRFNIEFPGIPMDPDSFVEFEIGGNGFDANNFKLEAFITENGIEVTRVGLLSIYNQGFKSLSIYPNPTSDFLTIAYDRLLSEDYVVEIHNLQGQLLIQEKLNDGFDQKLKIQVSHLESGVYLATFKQLGGRNATLSMKIVIKH